MEVMSNRAPYIFTLGGPSCRQMLDVSGPLRRYCDIVGLWGLPKHQMTAKAGHSHPGVKA